MNLRSQWMPLWLICLAGLMLQPNLAGADITCKPYRLLLVIGDQWKDASSSVIADGAEFQQLVILLKSWGVPFDIVRLDQERLSLNHFLDMSRQPRYGAILWDADPESSILKQNYDVLTEAVQGHHISLIAIADRIKEPAIQSLLGIRYRAKHSHSSRLKVTGDHFLTAGLPEVLDSDGPAVPFQERVQVEVREAQTLVEQGTYAQVTTRSVHPDAHAIWIGGDPARMLLYQPLRTLLKRSITHAIGYAVVKDWRHHIILMMDDLGNAQNAWLEHWHYPTLTADEIRRHLIGPLQKHNAVLVVNVLPGFVDDARREVVPSWQQVFTDEFGTLQNYRSTKEGLDEGVQAGVIEIGSHGWTHMQPDLESSPGPWWGTPLDGERAEVGWYREFFDIRRNLEIPAATQRFHLRQSKEWILEQFGIEPLSFATGGNAVSTTVANNTWRLAAREGFGWYGGYLGEDYAVQGNANATAPFGGSDDVPLILPAPPDGHDRGITHNPSAFGAVFTQYPGAHFIGLEEHIGYIHSRMRGRLHSGLEIAYPKRYCRYFQNHPSHWNLHLSSWLRLQMSDSNWELRINERTGRLPLVEWHSLDLDAGKEHHQIRLALSRQRSR
ncbi:MAG: hypothetical protein AB1898_21855 [Acidobacteriota bacterium]